MKSLLLVMFIVAIVLPIQNTVVSDVGPLVIVVSAKWSKSRLTTGQAQANATNVSPISPVTHADRIYQKRRVNAPLGDRPPSADTSEGRAAELERIVQESRTTKSKTVDGYAYRTTLKNAGTKIVEILFWEYQFSEPSSPSTMVRRQFLCGVNIKPGKEKEVISFSLSGPSEVISVGTLANKSGNTFHENVVINRVEYADGSIWQRRDWSFAEVKQSYTRAIATPWGAETCRAL